MNAEREALISAISEVRAGDEVTVEWFIAGGKRPPINGVVWEGADNTMFLGPAVIRYGSGAVPLTLVSLLEHKVNRPTITRGVTIENVEDGENWFIPDDTIFRDSMNDCIRLSSYIKLEDLSYTWFPLRCISVLKDDEEEWSKHEALVPKPEWENQL